MKRILAILTIVFLLAGCGRNVPEEPSEAETEPTETVTETEEVKFAYDIFGGDRQICVMIDNDGNSSRPHAGIEDAYLIYEMYVEGMATRLMAVFKGAETQKIGPVRSSRHYFLDYALDGDSLYAHAGWSPKAMEDIPALGVNNLNGLVYEPAYFWRERKYKGDYHSLYTSVDNLKSLAEQLGYRTASDVLPLNFTKEEVKYEGEEVKSITFPYASFYTVSYKYDEETGLYERYINSEYHPTQSGAKLYASQIIVQLARNYALGDGTARQQLDTVGEGEAFLLKDGLKTLLTWKRSARGEKLRFYTSDGNELSLTPRGQTYVQVIPPSMNYTTE